MTVNYVVHIPCFKEATHKPNIPSRFPLCVKYPNFQVISLECSPILLCGNPRAAAGHALTHSWHSIWSALRVSMLEIFLKIYIGGNPIKGTFFTRQPHTYSSTAPPVVPSGIAGSGTARDSYPRSDRESLTNMDKTAATSVGSPTATLTCSTAQNYRRTTALVEYASQRHRIVGACTMEPNKTTFRNVH